MVIQLILLIIAVSLDIFLVSASFGCNNIKVNLLGATIISLICTSFFIASMYFASILQNIYPVYSFKIFSFLILVTVGSYNIISNEIKRHLKNLNENKKKINLKIKEYNLITSVYIDETKIDFNHSKALEVKEAILIGFMVSIDTFCAGLSLPMSNLILASALTFIINFLFTITGFKLGKKLNDKFKNKIYYVGGILLIILGFTKLL